MKFKYLLIALSLLVFNVTLAEGTKINSFSASRTSIGSRQPLGLSWSSEGGAPVVVFNCPLGIKIVTIGNTAVSCNTDTIFSSNTTDAVDLLVTNLRSFSQTLSIKIIPRDLSGTQYPDLSRTIYVNVDRDIGPITDFSVKPDTTSGIKIKNYEPVVFSWTGLSSLEGVNFEITCNDNIQASSSQALNSYGDNRILFCGSKIFSSPLNSSGTATFYFYNRTKDHADLKFTILPYVGTDVYDTGHAKSITLSMDRNIAPEPFIFTSLSPNRILSQSTTTLSWIANNTAGINIMFSCKNNIKIFDVSTSTTPELLCNKYIFTDPTVASSSLSLKIVNNNTNQEIIDFSIVPMIIGGGYNGMMAKKVSVTVEARDYKGNFIQNLSGDKNFVPNNQNNISGRYGYAFNRSMYLGLRHSDVSELQKSLSRFKDIYPEGIVTGYFGPATERAIKRFQEKYGLAKVGDSGYGFVGPKTRAKLNEI